MRHVCNSLNSRINAQAYEFQQFMNYQNSLSERCSILNTTTQIKSVRLITRIVEFTRLHHSQKNIVFLSHFISWTFLQKFMPFPIKTTILPRLLEKSKKCRVHYSMTYYSTSQMIMRSLHLTHGKKSVHSNFKFISISCRFHVSDVVLTLYISYYHVRN